MTILLPNIIAIEVPKDVTNTSIFVMNNIPVLQFISEKEDSFSMSQTELPPGDYTIICTSDNATEEDAAKVVKLTTVGKFDGYMNYENFNSTVLFDLPTHSLSSLLRSHGLEPGEKNYLILKKNL